MKATATFLSTRSSGILLHPVSLPGKYGIGTIGNEAYAFVDALSEAGVRYWQILPLNPTDSENSPYCSSSAFAGNPFLISPDLLIEDKMIDADSMISILSIVDEQNTIDYPRVKTAQKKILQSAFHHFTEHDFFADEFRNFCKAHSYWLEDFACFSAIKEHFGHTSLQTWPLKTRNRQQSAMLPLLNSLTKEIEFYKFEQFLFYKQWMKLKTYANSKNVLIIGDVPIYVSADSADLWSHSNLFDVNDKLEPNQLAGVPPDYFSETGQLWGNPVYNWQQHESEHFSWWIKRMQHNLDLFDVVRLDHFRGFADYWSVPAGESTAVNGKWNIASGEKLFKRIQSKIGQIHLIAEDLGILSEGAVSLLQQLNFPGMKILQFAFNGEGTNSFLPHFYDENCVVYTGTHDNNTCKGWFEEEATVAEQEKLKAYTQCNQQEVSFAMIRLALSSVANTAIIPIQDLLSLGSEARMNIPGTVKNNWKWKMTSEQMTQIPWEQIQFWNVLFDR